MLGSSYGIGRHAAIFGLLGALAGGGVTYAVGHLDVRARREQADADRQERLLDVHRLACVIILTRADVFLDRARAVTAAADSGVVAAELAALADAYRSAWEDFTASSAAVLLAGPGALGDHADALRRRIGDVGDVIDARLIGTRWGSERDQAWAAASAARSALVVDARAV